MAGKWERAAASRPTPLLGDVTSAVPPSVVPAGD
jgi:hypothetical protein